MNLGLLKIENISQTVNNTAMATINHQQKVAYICRISIGSIDELRFLRHGAFIHALLSRAYLCVS